MPDQDQAFTIRDWAGPWRSFLSDYGQWWSRMDDGQPVYVLPDPVVNALSSEPATPRSAAPPISSDDAQAEHAFADVCRRFSKSTVGVWQDKPVDFPLISWCQDDVKLPDIPKDLANQWIAQGWLTKAPSKWGMQQLQHSDDCLRHQSLGYVGRLTFDPQYRAELQILRTTWDALPEKMPLDVPGRTLIGQSVPFTDADGKLVPLTQVDDLRELPPDAAQFYEQLGGFLKKWQLMCLVTWELPTPQGPIPGVPAGLLADLRGRDATADFYPAQYDIPSDEDIRGRTRDRQRNEGRSGNVDMEFPVTDTAGRYDRTRNRWKPSEYESAFRMWLIETAVTRRWGNPRGLVVRLGKAFENMFRISPERVKKLRQRYSRA